MKKELLRYLENQTAFMNLQSISDIFTAQKLAEIFQVKRNTVSHYLNQLNEMGALVKINSRPVYYFHKEAFEGHFFLLEKNLYQSVAELKQEQPIFRIKQDLFSMMIGYDKSLRQSIELIKTALYYPDNGLPVLIRGESGTGKSYLVRLIHKYCLENGLLEEGAPLVVLNCAQYANNPELLTSNLFGHVKGAFTGAEKGKIGAFEAADGGILFLDEVHRLNAEGQEKLFTYLDQGIIYRMGETNQSISVKTRLFFATTENLESHFLTTFIRRIPIKLELPAINQRTKDERLELVYAFLVQEQRRIKSSLSVTGQVLSLLTHSSFKGNIGELKNVVKVTVAKAFSEQKDNSKINVTIYHLPEQILANSEATSHSLIEERLVISDTTSLEQLISRNHSQKEIVINTFERMITAFQQNNRNLKACEESLKEEVDNLFDFLLFETDRQQKHEMLVYLTKYIRETFKQMETSYQIKFNGNSIYAVSYYLFQRYRQWHPEDMEIVDLMKDLEKQIASEYPASYDHANRILELCQPKLDLDISMMDKIMITMYLKRFDWSKELGIPKAIIVAHGYATASSIANVANRFIGKDIFESFDMPLDVTPQQIAEEILDYSEYHDVSNGLVILVDMGSLKEIYQYFPKRIQSPIVIMNNVTTPLAIAVGENLQKKLSLDDMIKKSATDYPLDWQIVYPKKNKINAIITTCFTGIGTAAQISQLLEKSLPSNCQLKIFPYEYEVLRRNKKQESVFSMYEVLGIIGTANPEIESIDYLSLEDLISGDENKRLTSWLNEMMTHEENEQFNENVIRNFSLEKVIDSVTILDTDKVMNEIELFMRNLESIAHIKINNAKKLALYVHVSCLIERLIRNVPIERYEGYTALVQCQKNRLDAIEKAFSVIEKDYSVKIPESEIAYIYDILFQNTDISAVEGEF